MTQHKSVEAGRVIYLAGPYTSADARGRVARYEALTKAAADLIADGHIVYSPITHTHPIDVHFVRDGVNLDSDFWCNFDETFMSVCTEMAILPLEGWEQSGGVKRERAYFEARGLPVYVLNGASARVSAPPQRAKAEPLIISGGWLDGSRIRRARAHHVCDNTRGIPAENLGDCLQDINSGDYYAEGDALLDRAGGFGRDRHCMACAGPEARAALSSARGNQS